MKGYSEHRVDAKGRLQLEWIRMGYVQGSVQISARENKRKDRGVDVYISLDEDDLLSALKLVGEDDIMQRHSPPILRQSSLAL